MKKASSTPMIFAAMLAGIAVGYVCHETWATTKFMTDLAGYFSIATDVFLRLIKMIISLLVFSTLTIGIAHLGDTKTIGRVGIKAMGWFVIASLVSLTIGLLLSNALQLGTHLGLPLPDVNASTNLKTGAFSLKDFISHLFLNRQLKRWQIMKFCKSLSSRSFLDLRWPTSAIQAKNSLA